ncbi:MAG: hypothetical protein JWO11_4466 [Nocardioides sp.]|nr:hypothetical protein [Nocardioides sp.]
MGLREMAAAAAGPGDSEAGWVDSDQRPTPPAAEPLPDIEYTQPIVDVEPVQVHVAWARVMRDVTSIRKDRVADIKTDKGGYRFNFRGIDQVLNAVGPALRRHGVMVTPVHIDATYGNAGRMRDVQVTVTYEIRGPLGDTMPAMSVGEGLDAGERGTPKALTTAYRNMLIVALAIPTEDPKMDPDVVDLRREETPTVRPSTYRDEIADPRTSLARLRQISSELKQHNVASAMVVNEVGDDETLWNMYVRVVGERRAAGESS